MRNPMIGLAFARRLASFQIMLAKELGMPPPPPAGAVEIVHSLIDFPTNCTPGNAPPPPPPPPPRAAAPAAAARRGNAGNTSGSGSCSWVGYGNATVQKSGDFSLYPIWPTEYVSQGSSEQLLRTARNTIKTYVSTADFVTGRPVLTFPAAVRAGFSSSSAGADTTHSGSGSVSGYRPEEVMAGLKAWLANTEHTNGVMQDRDDDRTSDCGVMRAVNEMLLQAPNDGSFIELFPFFPANESASFVTLRAKGGWLVSATRAAATAADVARGSRGGLVTGVEIEATVDGTLRLVDPWAAAARAVGAAGAQSQDAGGNSTSQSHSLPTVSCVPAPAAPAVSWMSAAGHNSLTLIGWEMRAGQKCSVEPSSDFANDDHVETSQQEIR